MLVVRSTKWMATRLCVVGRVGWGGAGVEVAAQDEVATQTMLPPPGAAQRVQVAVETQFVG